MMVLFSSAGFRIIDSSDNDHTVMEPRSQSHPMWVQAGQLLLLTDRSARVHNESLNDIIAVLTNYKTADGTQFSKDLLRAYFLSALTNAHNPDELAWRDLLVSQDTTGSNLTAALAPSGPDYPLTLLQAVLLLTRARADLLQLLHWESQQTTTQENPLQDPALTNREEKASFQASKVVAAPDPTTACRLDNFPGWASDWLAARNDIVNLIAAAAKGAVKGAEGKPSLTMGILGAVTTLTNFLFTYFTFHASVTVAQQPLHRTKLTSVDLDQVAVSSLFETSHTGEALNDFLNCLRVDTTFLYNLSFTMPEAGPWKNATTSISYAGSNDAIRWVLPNNAGLAEGTISGVTGSDGKANFLLTGIRQRHELSKDAKETDRSTRITASINPETMNKWYANLAQYFIDQLQVIFAAATGSLPVLADGTLKDLIHLLNNVDFWHSDPVDLTIKDWNHPTLRYTVTVARDRQGAIPTTCRDEGTTEHLDFQLQAEVPLDSAATQPDGSVLLSGRGPLHWVRGVDDTKNVSLVAGCPGGAGSAIVCAPDPSGYWTSTTHIASTIDGQVAAKLVRSPTSQSVELNIEPNWTPGTQSDSHTPAENTTTVSGNYPADPCATSYQQRTTDFLSAYESVDKFDPGLNFGYNLKRDRAAANPFVSTFTGTPTPNADGDEDKFFGAWRGVDSLGTGYSLIEEIHLVGVNTGQ